MNIKLLFNTLLLFLVSYSALSQTKARQEQQQKVYKEKVNEIKNQLISDVCESLKLDAFEHQIVAQKMYSYFNELERISAMKIQSREKQELLDILDKSHFNDLKTILEAEEIDFILNQIKGDWKRNQKKKRKKNKKQKN